MREGFHHSVDGEFLRGTIFNFEDEVLERIRQSAPDIYRSQKDDKRTLLNRQRKEDERMKAAGYSKQYSGGFVVWKKGCI